MNPLQIFEKHPEADAYRVGGFYSPYALVSQDKRFTDAELAAECYRARWTVELRQREGREVLEDNWAKVDAIHRFATLPHFDA